MVPFGGMGPDLEEGAFSVNCTACEVFPDIQDTAGCQKVEFESHLSLSYCHGTPGGISGHQS